MLGEEFQLPLDPGGFSPRACPRCRAEFKVRWGRRDSRALASALSGRLGHLNRGEAGPAVTVRRCPYCAAAAAAEAWWTRKQRRWFERRVEEFARELRWRRMRVPLETLRDNPHPTYVVVPPPRSTEPAPVPDGDDLVTVPLPCCGEEVRIDVGWAGPVWCHFCGYVHTRSATRDAWRELAQLRSWRVLP